LETTGIFLFSMYKYPKFWWSIALFGVKLVVMFITSIAGRVWKYVYIGLPAFYMIVVFLHGYHRPYLLGPLTVLNFVLYILQALHCLIPICAMFGKPILDGVYVPIAIALIVIPILSCVLILCCQRNSFDDDDPTIPDNRKKNKSKKGGGTSFQDADWDIQAGQFFKAAGGRLHTRSSCADGPAQSGGNLARKTTLIGEDLDQSQPPVWKPIPAGGMEMIADFEAKERAHAKHMKNYEVNTVVMQPAIGEMYKVLDYVIDGVTIGTLIRTVYWAMIIGSMAFGWYLGALRGVVRGREMVACGEA
jgi:hypothetical protein